MIPPGARAVLDAARCIVEILPEEGLDLADLITASKLPGDVVRRAVRLLDWWAVVWEEADAVHPEPGWIEEGPAVIADAERIGEALPDEGCSPLADVADRADVPLLRTALIIEGLHAAGLVRRELELP